MSGCAEQQRILEKEGADLSRWYFSHVDATFGWEGRTVEQEIDYLERVVEKGSFLSFNNFGNWNHTKTGDLALIINELTARGDRRSAVDLLFLVNGYRKCILGFFEPGFRKSLPGKLLHYNFPDPQSFVLHQAHKLGMLDEDRVTGILLPVLTNFCKLINFALKMRLCPNCMNILV